VSSPPSPLGKCPHVECVRAKRPRYEHRTRRDRHARDSPLGVVAEIETPPPPAWRGESPVDGGRLTGPVFALSSPESCMAPDFVRRAPALASCQSRGCPSTKPSLDEGPPAGHLGADHLNRGGMGANPFGLSLPLEWCSRSVQLAPSRECRLKSRRDAKSSSLGSRLGRGNERKR
jgi:hypothetical protein